MLDFVRSVSAIHVGQFSAAKAIHARRLTVKRKSFFIAGPQLEASLSWGFIPEMTALKEAGWRLTEEGEKLCGGSVKVALDMDLRDIGAESLPEEINRGKATVVEGGLVLQVKHF